MQSWDDLRYLLAIARHGSLAGAGRELGVNHSTVFRRLNAFEARIGARVFDRRADGYVATLAGEEILRHAEAADAAVLALERTVAGKDYRLAGTLRLTTAPYLATHFVAPLLPGFLEQHPDIVVEIASGDRGYDLARREADLALRATPAPPEFLVGRRVCGGSWWAAASPAYLRGRPRPDSVAALAQHRLIGADASLMRLAVFARLRAQLGEAVEVARANELNTMAALARAGLGIAVLPNDQRQPELEFLFRIEVDPPPAIWLLTHPDLRHVARVRAFSDWLIERLRADPRLQQL